MKIDEIQSIGRMVHRVLGYTRNVFTLGKFLHFHYIEIFKELSRRLVYIFEESWRYPVSSVDSKVPIYQTL